MREVNDEGELVGIFPKLGKSDRQLIPIWKLTLYCQKVIARLSLLFLVRAIARITIKIPYLWH
ncbi:MAG: hypothetical protein RM338_03825 [Nostoc sp. DedQUE12a]|nr:hypothetical protein [Nostoc sp. DedQUE12a]